jgi:hydroxyacylglutathione hydrolase
MLKVHYFTFGPFAENTYLVYDDTTLDCAIIDPGCLSMHEENTLREFIQKNDLQPFIVLNTHCHIDHIYGNKFVTDTYQIPLWYHRTELPVMEAAQRVAVKYGLPQPAPSPTPHFIEAGDTITIGKHTLQTLFTPGHSPGSVSFYAPDDQFILSGDVLFEGSIGRTDFEGGNFDILKNSILTQLYTLPETVVVYPGHGQPTSIHREKYNNPFVRIK